MDFCPSAEQVKLHDDLYGFDYKPSVRCEGDSIVPAPSAGDPRSGSQGDPDAECTKLKEDLRSATPLHDHDPSRIVGELANGDQVFVHGFGEAETMQSMTLSDYAAGLPC